jgi:hypothetical protein
MYAATIVLGCSVSFADSDDYYGWGKVGLGINYPGVSLRYCFNQIVSIEGRGQISSGSDNASAFGGRLYCNILKTHRVITYGCIEGDVVSFKGGDSNASGYLGGVFAGLEYFIRNNLSLQGDIGPAFVSLNGNSVQVGSLHYVVNFGLTYYLGQFGASTQKTDMPVASAPLRSKPPKLIVHADIDTGNSSKALEPEEQVYLTLSLKNEGGGAARDIDVVIKHEPKGPWLSYPPARSIELIDVGESKAGKIPLTINRDAPEGAVSFHIEAKEGQGFDADPVEIRCMSHAFRPPDIRLAKTTVFDGQGSFAFGNGNGIIEPGESAELTLNVKNVGKGVAKNPTISVTSSDPSVIFLALNGKETNSMQLASVAPQQDKEIKLAIAVTKRFAGSTRLPIRLEIVDSRPGLRWDIELPIDVAKGSSKTTVINVGGVSTTIQIDGPASSVSTIAAADLQPQGVSASDAANATDWLRSALVGTKIYRVVERENMNKVLAEQAVQNTGCTQQDCAVRLGRVLNVQRIIVGTVGTFAGNYTINIRVVNVETGEVTYADQCAGKDIDAIQTGIRALASRTVANLR